MVAKTPTKQRRMAAALNPALVREALNKVDRCMARLQELQYTVVGGSKVVAGATLSPRSTRSYLKTSLRCKQESLRMRNNGTARKSPVGKFQGSINGDWKRMSLPAMLLGETMVEILQASQTAKEAIAGAATAKIARADPKTPVTIRRANKLTPHENSEMQARRTKEKQRRLRIVRRFQGPVSHQIQVEFAGVREERGDGEGRAHRRRPTLNGGPKGVAEKPAMGEEDGTVPERPLPGLIFADVVPQAAAEVLQDEVSDHRADKAADDAAQVRRQVASDVAQVAVRVDESGGGAGSEIFAGEGGGPQCPTAVLFAVQVRKPGRVAAEDADISSEDEATDGFRDAREDTFHEKDLSSSIVH
ncbi:hypothetical protein Cni_G07825 [Canna indica]|uniref:Uncharacterized protein n=1 Tax=Canna indica TaxID=4628 RepID=A0AAQ3Q666_9LILI|nr:hypothetical protein Cni_G07825 [Canna indica]